MLKEDYKNKIAKSSHYAYVYFFNGKKECITLNGKIIDIDGDLENVDNFDDNLKIIKNDCGLIKKISREYKKICLNYKEGDLFYNYKELKSLMFSPKHIKGSFSVHHNQLTSLKGAPEKIYGHFACSDNKIPLEEVFRYINKTYIGGSILTDYGYFKNQEEAIEKLSGQIKESYFGY